MATKLNVNIRTLLTNCEDLSKSEDNFWRLQKFLKSLSIMINELEAMAEWVVVIVQWKKQLIPSTCTVHKVQPGYPVIRNALPCCSNWLATQTLPQSMEMAHQVMWHCRRWGSCRTRPGTMSCARICCKVDQLLPCSLSISIHLLTAFPPAPHRCRHTAPATWRRWWWRLRRCWSCARRQHERGGQVSYHSAGEDHRAHALANAQSQGANGDGQ